MGCRGGLCVLGSGGGVEAKQFVSSSDFLLRSLLLSFLFRLHLIRQRRIRFRDAVFFVSMSVVYIVQDAHAV